MTAAKTSYQRLLPLSGKGVVDVIEKEKAPRAFSLRRLFMPLRGKQPAVARQHVYIFTVSATSLKSWIWSKFMYL